MKFFTLIAGLVAATLFGSSIAAPTVEVAKPADEPLDKRQTMFYDCDFEDMDAELVSFFRRVRLSLIVTTVPRLR